jgi:hypothetical protein
MAHLIIRNRDNGITLESHEFAPESRHALYETYTPGAHIVCGTSCYIVRSLVWDRASQEMMVGVTFEVEEPSAPADCIVDC